MTKISEASIVMQMPAEPKRIYPRIGTTSQIGPIARQSLVKPATQCKQGQSNNQ